MMSSWTAGGGSFRLGYRFIEANKAVLVLLTFICSMRVSMASISFMDCRKRRRIQMFWYSSEVSSSSSFRVPDLVMWMAGKMRFSAMLRERWSSMLPVPLNSSKMTSSIFEPVSIRAVAIMVREPPSSMLRAAPKKRLGLCRALASTPPVSILPEVGTTVL